MEAWSQAEQKKYVKAIFPEAPQSLEVSSDYLLHKRSILCLSDFSQMEVVDRVATAYSFGLEHSLFHSFSEMPPVTNFWKKPMISTTAKMP